VFSLTNFLKTLARNTDLLSRERFMALWPDTPEASNQFIPEITYRRFSSDGRTFDRKIVEADLKKLQDDHDAILKYTNSSIAHCGSDPNTTVMRHDVDWDDLDSLYLDITAIFNKYYALFDRGVHVDFIAVLPAGFDKAFHGMLRIKR